MNGKDEGEKVAGNLFLQMVLTLQTSAMQHMGKIVSPFTGKVERDLVSAEAAIDMLLMLRDKTKGNLNDVEEKILDRVVYELQMNYVEESKRPEPEEKKEAEAGTGAESQGEPPSEGKGQDAADDSEARESRGKAKGES